MFFTRQFLRTFLFLLRLTTPIWGFLVLVICIIGLLISHVERIPVGNALYFAFITALTVGYGDIAPHSMMGRILAVLLPVTGVITSGIVVAVALQAVKSAYGLISEKK